MRTMSESITNTFPRLAGKIPRLPLAELPTPIDAHNRPDLTPIESATETVAQVLEKDDIFV